MKLKEAMDIIETKEKGFRVHFEIREGSTLRSDFFPEREEDLIKSEVEAWELAKRFAKAVDPKIYVNIYVTDETFSPVQGYDLKKLNRL